MLFCSIFVFLILRVLFDMVTLLVVGVSAALSLGLIQIIFCIHLTFARSISASPHSFSDAHWLSVSFGYHCLTKTKVGVQAGWGLPRRQISLTIYLHSLYFPLMWVGEGGQQRPQSPPLYNKYPGHQSLASHPVIPPHQKGSQSFPSVTSWEDPPW